MEKLYKIIVVFLLCFVSSMVKAQENNGDMISIPVSMYDRFRSDIKQSRDSITLFVDSCARLNSHIQKLESSYLQLSESNETNQRLAETNLSIIESKDSLIAMLCKQHETDSIDVKNNESRLLEMQKKVDETSAKYANGRLYFKFDAERIRLCIEDYNKITTASVKEQFKQMPELLRSYGSYSDQLKGLLLSAQNDPDRKVRNKAEEYKSKYANEIRSLFYYTNYYAKKNSGTWSIPYLNNIIEVALSILQKHDPGHNDPVNFNSLIEML